MSETQVGVSTFETTQELSGTRDELMWFFTSSDATMGLHAAGPPIKVEDPYDEARQNEAHRKRHTAWHRRQIAKRARVVEVLLSLERWHREDLVSVYMPFGAGRVSAQTMAILTRQKRPLLGLLLHTEAVRRAFRKSYDTEDAPPGVLLRFVDGLLEGKANEPLKNNHPLRRALDEADARETAAARAYDALRKAALEAERHEEHDRLHRELEAVSKRMAIP